MRLVCVLTFICALLGATHDLAAQGRVIKVLPHFLDQNGRHTLSPSLYERDAYQAWLRKHPEEQSALRFDVQWSIWYEKPVVLRLELRGVAEGNEPKQTTLEIKVNDAERGRRWTSLTLGGEKFKQFGKVTAWRASLWQDGKKVGEQSSFLW